MKITLLFACLVLGGIFVETLGARLKRASGGLRIDIEQAPYVVSLRRSRRHVCCGALISTQHVLTAAHCVYDGSEYLYETRVVCGTDEVDETDIGHKIKNITKHSDYEEGMFWCDIAVVTLSAHVERNDRQRKVALSYAEPPYGRRATLSAFKTPRVADHGLQQFTMTIQKTTRTSINADYYDQGFDGIRKFIHGINNSDCGGPLVGGGRLIGILTKKSSSGSRVCYFGNVVKFINFIEKCMGAKTSLNSKRPPVILWAPKRPRL